MGAVELEPGAIPGSAGAGVAEMKRRGCSPATVTTASTRPPLVIAENELEELADVLAATVRDLSTSS